MLLYFWTPINPQQRKQKFEMSDTLYLDTYNDGLMINDKKNRILMLIQMDKLTNWDFF